MSSSKSSMLLAGLLLVATAVQAGFWNDAKAEGKPSKEQAKGEGKSLKQEAKKTWSGFKQGVKQTGEGFKEVGRAFKKDAKKSVDKAKRDLGD